MMFSLKNTANIQFNLAQTNLGSQGKNSDGVIEGFDTQLHTTFVYKRISKKRYPDLDEYFKEASILFNAKHHNVAIIQYACDDRDFIYLAMNKYPHNLKDVIDNRFLTVREIIRYSIHILSGLSFIHSKKLIHFDVKPDNVLISQNNEGVLSDFGLAKYIDQSTGLAQQTKMYTYHSPPERFVSNQFGIGADLYQVGLTIYRMCNGNQDFDLQVNNYPQLNDLVQAIIKGNFPERNKFSHHIPNKLKNVVKKLIHVDIGKRYQTALDAINDLAKIEECLDWQFNGVDSWSLDLDDKIFLVQVSQQNSSTFSIKTTKKMKNNDRITNVSKFCKDSLSLSDKNSILEEVFKDCA